MSGGNKGTGRTTSLNGTILVDLSSVKSLDKMFPLYMRKYGISMTRRLHAWRFQLKTSGRI